MTRRVPAGEIGSDIAENALGAELAGLVSAPPDAVRAALPRVAQALSAAHPGLRIVATVVAGRAGAAGLPLLSQAQRSAIPEVRQFASLGLGQVGARGGAVDRLVAALRDGDRTTAQVAASALGHCGGDAVGPLRSIMGADGGSRRSADVVRALGGAAEGSGAVPPEIAQARRAADPRLAVAAAEASVRATGDPQEGLDDLISRLQDDDPEIRREAAVVCGRLMDKGRAAAASLQTVAFGDPVGSVRASAVTALALVGGNGGTAAENLARSLGDGDLEVQKAAIIGLASFEAKGRSALPALAALRGVADEDLRLMIDAAVSRIEGTS